MKHNYLFAFRQVLLSLLWLSVAFSISFADEKKEILHKRILQFIKQLSNPESKTQENAKKELIEIGKPAYAILEKQLPKLSLAAQKIAKETLWNIAWESGYKKLCSELELTEEATKNSGNRAGSVTLELLDSPLIEPVFPNLKFYRLVRHSKYYKPGQSWHGSLYCIKKFKNEVRRLYTVGQDRADKVLESLLTLSVDEGLLFQDKAAIKNLLALELPFYGNHYQKTIQKIQRVAHTWEVTLKTSSFLQKITIEVDVKHKAIKWNLKTIE